MSELVEVLKEVVEGIDDPFKKVLFALVGSKLLTKLQHDEVLKNVTRDDIRWVLNEVKRCGDDECLEEVVEELMKRVEASRRV